MPNYLEYQKSVAAEFKAYENRVRNLIDDHHWAEDGRFKEIILMNYLKRILPSYASVGTGFVKSKDSITKQIDIIIYQNKYPTLFSEVDFSEPYYSIYDMPESLAFAYFISNLQEYVMRYMSGEFNEKLPDVLDEFLYPLQGGKEQRLIKQIPLR